MKFLVLLAIFATSVASAETKFVEKSFIEFVTGRTPTSEEIRQLPLYVEVPESFVSRGNLPKIEGMLIGEPNDIDRVVDSGEYTITENGIFRAAVSYSTVYFNEKDKFSGEDDSPENMEKYGLKNFQVKRLSGAVPMLLSTAEKDGRKTFLLNVAVTRPARTTMKIFFYQSKHRGSLDEETVRRFIKRLSSD